MARSTCPQCFLVSSLFLAHRSHSSGTWIKSYFTSFEELFVQNFSALLNNKAQWGELWQKSPLLLLLVSLQEAPLCSFLGRKVCYTQVLFQELLQLLIEEKNWCLHFWQLSIVLLSSFVGIFWRSRKVRFGLSKMGNYEVEPIISQLYQLWVSCKVGWKLMLIKNSKKFMRAKFSHQSATSASSICHKYWIEEERLAS